MQLDINDFLHPWRQCYNGACLYVQVGRRYRCSGKKEYNTETMTAALKQCGDAEQQELIQEELRRIQRAADYMTGQKASSIPCLLDSFNWATGGRQWT